MRWGVALNVRDRVSESLRKAKAADQGGIDQVWITDFPAMRYAPAVAAAVAEGTKSCRIGVGLVSPLLYSTTQIVQFMSTLIDSYGERFDLLLGPGDKLTLARIGVSYSSRTMVAVTKRTLEEVKTKFSEMDNGCSILLGAQGPIMIKASLKADGILLNYSDLEMIKWALDQIKGYAVDDFQIGLFPPTYIGTCEDIESNQEISSSAAMVAIGLNSVVSEAFGLHEQIVAARSLMKKKGSIDSEVIALLGKDILQRFAFCGTDSHLFDYIKKLENLGISSVVFGPPQGVRKRGVDILVQAKSVLETNQGGR
jgi:hypothetical protein